MSHQKNNPRISAIAALARKNRVIGTADGKIPWHISEDFRHFKETTMGHPIIMGRKTFDSFGGRTLPGRTHIVITRRENYSVPEGVILVNSLEKAIEEARAIDGDEIFIIGGGQIYSESIPYLDRIYITLVDVDVEGPVTFPEYENIFTRQISARQSQDEKYTYEFLVLEKS